MINYESVHCVDTNERFNKRDPELMMYFSNDNEDPPLCWSGLK